MSEIDPAYTALLTKHGLTKMPVFMGVIPDDPPDGPWYVLSIEGQSRLLVVGVGNMHHWYKPCTCNDEKKHLEAIALEFKNIGAVRFKPNN